MNFTDFLRFLVSDTSYKGWEQSASSWFFLIIVVVIICMILMSIVKIIIKATAAHAKDKIWKRTSAWGWIFLGFLPISFVLCTFWYVNTDFYKVAYVGGLVKGILLAWVMYFLLSLILHFVMRSWRNEL